MIEINYKRLLISLILIILLILVFEYGDVLLIKTGIVKIGPAQKYPTPGPLDAELSNLISRYKSGETAFIDFSTITLFNWDQVYFFGPHPNLSDLDTKLGSSWDDECFTTIYFSDNYTLIAFLNNKEVSYCLEYPIGLADFSNLEEYESGFLAEDAKFILDQDGRIIWAGKE